MCASTVSSKMLQTMGLMEGFRFEETLTGFKWIGSCALSLQERGYQGEREFTIRPVLLLSSPTKLVQTLIFLYQCCLGMKKPSAFLAAA